jgi:hypothetical protein
VRGLPLACLVALAVAPSACDTTTVAVEVAAVEIVPATLTLLEGEERTLVAVARAASGAELSGRSVSWTSLSPLVATIDDGGRVTAIARGEATIRANVEGVTATAELTVLAAPSVSLSSDQVDLEATQGSASEPVGVDVTNGGAGTLSGLSVAITYPDEEPTGWLTATLNGTTAPTSLTLRGAAGALEPGDYEATVVVSSSSGPGSSAAIRVTLSVAAPPPLIVLDPDAVALVAVQNGQGAATQTVSVTNGGGGILLGLELEIRYASGQPTGWLAATLTGPIAPTVVELSASPQGLAPGEYDAVVEVSSPVALLGSREIAVQFTVAAAGAVARRRP